KIHGRHRLRRRLLHPRRARRQQGQAQDPGKQKGRVRNRTRRDAPLYPISQTLRTFEGKKAFRFDSFHTNHMQPRPKTRQRSQSHRLALFLLIALSAVSAHSQPTSHRVTLTVVDENSLPVPDASVTISSSASPSLHLQTDYAGRCTFSQPRAAPYQLRV